MNVIIIPLGLRHIDPKIRRANPVDVQESRSGIEKPLMGFTGQLY